MRKSLNKIITYTLLTILFIIGSSFENKMKNRRKIRTAFNVWCETKISEGVFFGIDSCNTAYYLKHDAVEAKFGMGIPIDTSEIKYFFIDINDDNNEDAVATFFVDQCDCGNALMFAQYKLLILSIGEKYIVNDSIIENSVSNDWIEILDTVSNGTYAFGRLYKYIENDPYPYPSVTANFELNLENWKAKIYNIDTLTKR